MSIEHGIIAGVLVAATLQLGGCATDVAPWERGHLSKREMAIEPDPLEASMRQHSFFSKEGAAGGYGIGGGGCGCN